jgi:CheY-like chemotaxis protein
MPALVQRLAGLRILAVDDQPESLEPTCWLLEAHGASVKCATSADQAVTELSAFPADVLLVDLSMPEKDGFDFLMAARERGAEAPAIAFTAHNTPEMRARAREAGFRDFVTKPVEPVKLVDAIHAVAPSRSA